MCFCLKVYWFTLYTYKILYFYFNNVRAMVSDKIEDVGPIAEWPVGQSNTSKVLIIFLTHTCLLSIMKNIIKYGVFVWPKEETRVTVKLHHPPPQPQQLFGIGFRSCKSIALVVVKFGAQVTLYPRVCTVEANIY